MNRSANKNEQLFSRKKVKA